MKKLLLVLSLVTLASLAFAQSTNGSPRAEAQPSLAAGPHTLKATYVSSGNLGTAFLPASTYVPVDAGQTISCPGTSGTCLIQADSWVQVGESSHAGNEAALCFYVDGSLINSSCFFGAQIPNGYNWVQTSTSTFATVPFGTHYVQTKVFTTMGAYGGFYSVNYKVFKP